jgi:hypothetical protein
MNEDAAAEVHFITTSFLPYLIGHRLCLEKQWQPSKGQSLLAAAGNIAECSSRVKADILFSYQLPVNLVALCIMLPASYILSPRWFHKVNALEHEFISSDRCLFSGQRLHDKVRDLFIMEIRMHINLLLRVTSFPILLFISFYERQAKLIGAITFYDTVTHLIEKVFDTLPRALKRMSTCSFGVFVFRDLTFYFSFLRRFGWCRW